MCPTGYDILAEEHPYPNCPWCHRPWHGLPIGHCPGSHTTPTVPCDQCPATTPHSHGADNCTLSAGRSSAATHLD